jgi:anti-sigma28 factor (negative regulator of flagellin synthesis)
MSQISISAYGTNGYDPTAKTTAKKSAAPAATAQEGSSVQLSDTAVSIAKLRNAINSMQDVRIPMVDQIKQKIQEDGYPIESALYKAMTKMVTAGIV